MVDPYKRSNWNQDILQRINDLCENPDPGCDPLDPLPLTEYPHRWSKEDITNARNKLIEICPENSFSEMNTPQLWDNSDLLTPLEEAIERGWCNCEPEETIYELGTFSASELETARYESESGGIIKSWTACGTYYTQYHSTWHPYPEINDILYDIYSTQRAIIATKSTAYYPAVRAVWAIEDEIEVLTSEVDTLEGELAAIEADLETANNLLTYLEEQRDIICGNDPGSIECEDAQTAVEEQQIEVDYLLEQQSEKETELAEKETELSVKEAELPPAIATRDQLATEWDEAAIAAWNCLQGIQQRYPTDINLIRDYFPTMHEPWKETYEDSRVYYPPKWEVYQYNICLGSTTIRSGRFSPGGYPQISSGGTTLTALTNLELACKYVTSTTWHDCSCFAWKMNPDDCCFGQEDGYECGHYDSTIYWAYVFVNPLPRTPHCVNPSGEREAPYDYTFTLYLTRAS